VLDRIEAVLDAIEAYPDPRLRDSARELVRQLLDFHRDALARMVELSPDAGAGLAADPRVAPMLLLHGLHPDALHVRVERALEKVRPYLGSHGGSVELVAVEDGRVRLRLQGSCNGCPSSAETLRMTLSEAILAAAPDAEGVEVV
jgi:Fe-S cluster biogenesis protein NfuA